MSQQYGVKLDDIDIGHPGAILYGVTPDNKLIPIQIDGAGVLAGSGSGGGTVDQGAPASSSDAWPVSFQGSANSFFADPATLELTSTFQALTFGFTSYSISIYNDSSATIDYSFNGSSTHGRLLTSEAVAMDGRAQPHVFLKTISGLTASYRVSAY